MESLVSLITKTVHFTFGNNIYLQKDGVTMGYPVGPVSGGILWYI